MDDKGDQLSNLLPDVLDSFCFNQNEFSSHEFEVDLFIKRHQNNMPLEQLREDLSIYLRKLRLSLVDLINSDYEEFIHLTTNYIDLNNNINNLLFSLTKLKRDVEQSDLAIQQTIDKLNENLDFIRCTLKQKKDLIFILNASKLIDTIELDLTILKANDQKILKTNVQLDPNFNKLAYQLNQINHKLDRLSLNSTYVNQTFKCKLDELTEEMNCYLIVKVETFIETGNVNGLVDLMESSVLNQKYDHFVDLIFQKLFEHKLQDFICDLNIDKLGIVKFYEELFNICDNGLYLFKQMNTIDNHLSKPANKLETNLIDDLIDRASKKIYTDLSINAFTLFLAGNPETFIQHFKETIQFFRRLLSLSDRKPEQFKIFNEIKQKFNCEIYFHIRQSEVSDRLSRALERPIVIESNQIKIQLIDELIQILNFIWSDQIYINTLFFDFWKLTLMLIARYTLFLKQFQFQNMQTVDQSNILIHLINESSLLINSVQHIYSSKIRSKIPVKCNEFELTNCLNQSFETLFVVGLPSINGLLKQVFCAQCLTILNQIQDIPRLYRKTNRDVPSRPSGYIVNCNELFQQLNQISKYSINLIIEILNEVTNNFFSLASDVLNNLQRTEECLMRLKKTTNGNVKNANKSIMSDSDKIRLQFKLDVNYYVQNGIGSLNVEKASLMNLNALMKLVEQL